jgi:hypothetical protein
MISIFMSLPVHALKVSNRPGDKIIGGSAGFSSVLLDADDKRVQSIQLGLRGAYFVAERWAIGAGAFFDRTDQDDTERIAQRYLVELLLVPIPDATVSPFLRGGAGVSQWKWKPGSSDAIRINAYTAEAAVGIFAFLNDNFALAIDATYFYDQYEENPNNDEDHNVAAMIGFVGFLR